MKRLLCGLISLGFSSGVFAAEFVKLNFHMFSWKVPVQQLEDFAASGELDGESSILKKMGPEKLNDMLEWLRIEHRISAVKIKDYWYKY